MIRTAIQLSGPHRPQDDNDFEKQPKMVLDLRMILLGGLPEPLHTFPAVRLYALSESELDPD